MNHPTTNPNSGGNVQSVPSYPQPNLQQQNHPFTSYHQYPPPPPPPPPMTPGYYYSPQHQHGQHSNVSYPQQQQSSYKTQQLRQQHATSATTAQNNSWPGPPTADNKQQQLLEQMDTTSRSPSPASYAIERAASALSAFSQQQQQSNNDDKMDDPLLNLARAASFQDSLTTGSPPMSLSTSPSPSSSPTTLLHTPSAGPLKKRRKVLGIEKEDDEMKKSQADDNDNKNDSSKTLNGGESNSPSLVPSLAWSSKSSSVEDMMKDTSSNSNDMSRHFPNVLHKLLSNTSDRQGDDNKISLAMEWLNHGKAFRVLRYDILCTEVLPKEMPMLCSDKRKKEKMQDGIYKSESRDDEQTKVVEEGRKEQVYSDDEWVEAFSWFVKSYGFEEVMSGRDKGSFRHEFFVRGSPDLCNKMKLVAHSHSAVMSNNSTQLTPTFSTVKMIGTPPRGLNISPEQTTTVWRSTNGKSSRGGISSIFKPRSNSITSHPSHLNVPMLSSTASFAESWMNGGNTQHYQAGPYPPRPPLTRSPKTIRFRDEADNRDDAAIEISTQNNREVSPSPHYRGRKQLSSVTSPGLPPRGGGGGGSGFVSRRGRRPPMISRHSTH